MNVISHNSRDPGTIFARCILSLLMLRIAGIHSASAPAQDTQTNSSATARLFHIRHLAYDKDGRLGEAAESLRASATSLFYGEKIGNAVFSAKPGPQSVSSATLEAETPERRENAPARPPRPQYRIDRWHQEQGLPANKVTALLQTRDGYLWVGTTGGLARFDRVRFTVFTEANTPEMQANDAVGRALFEDDAGQLWVATERGILCYSKGR